MTHPYTPQQVRGDGVRIGGLMRCCLKTIGDLYPNGPAFVATEGQQLRCKYLPELRNHLMIFRSGAWEWDTRNVALQLAPPSEEREAHQ